MAEMTQAQARQAAIAAGNSAAQVDAFIAKEGGARTSAQRISSAFQPTPGSSTPSGGGKASGWNYAGTNAANGPEAPKTPVAPGGFNPVTGAYNTANGQAPIAPQNYDRTPEPTATPAPAASPFGADYDPSFNLAAGGKPLAGGPVGSSGGAVANAVQGLQAASPSTGPPPAPPQSLGGGGADVNMGMGGAAVKPTLGNRIPPQDSFVLAGLKRAY